MPKEKSFDKVKYNNQYISEKYDRINLTVPKGNKDIIAEHAESVNGFINRAIRETMERDAKPEEGETNRG